MLNDNYPITPNNEINYAEVCFSLIGVLSVCYIIKHPETIDRITDIINKIIK